MNKLTNKKRKLEAQQIEFSNRIFLAISLTGLTVWSIFIGTVGIVYLGLFLSKFTGENKEFRAIARGFLFAKRSTMGSTPVNP